LEFFKKFYELKKVMSYQPETQIDQMVYALYGLTADEIAIIEGSVR